MEGKLDLASGNFNSFLSSAQNELRDFKPSYVISFLTCEMEVMILSLSRVVSII